MDNHKYNRPKRETWLLILKTIERMGGCAFAVDIAERLRLNESTVRTHLRGMLGRGWVSFDMITNPNTGGFSRHFYSLVKEEREEYAPPY